MSKKTTGSAVVYDTEVPFSNIRSNHPVKSKYLAAILAMLFGLLGVNQFYLRHIVRGIIVILVSAVFVVLDFFFTPPLILIPVAFTVIRGIIYLSQSDEKFQAKNHVRTV